MTVGEARRQFPHTWTDMVYLNHAAISPTSFRVREAVANYLERRSLKDIECFPWAPKMAEQTKQMLASRLGTTSDRLAFVLNTSDGLNILTEGIAWKESDRILIYRYEYPTNVYPFLNQSRKGVVIDYLEPIDGKITVEAIAAAIKPETKLLTLSHVQFLNGYRADLEAIGRFCKEKNIIFCVDAIQGFPYLMPDVEKAQIDFLSCGGHKWLMSPEGIAFIYVSTECQAHIAQAAMGWTSVKNAFNHFDFDLNRIRDDASRYENGTMNYAGICGMKASLEFFEEFGYDQMQKQTLGLADLLIDLCNTHGVEVTTPKNEHGGIVTINIEDAEAKHKKLEEKNIIGALRGGKLRFAPYFYTTEEEVRKAISELLS